MRYTRRLVLSGACNVRDLGGYPCTNGISAWHKCYRSDMLNKLTEEDWIQLRNADIQLILDLRSVTEQRTAAYDSEAYGITRVALPFMKEEVPLAEMLDQEAQKRFLDSMKLDYVEMISAVPDAVCQALRLILKTLRDGHAVLFHCTAGKDRTGILAALLLKLCGVCNEDILADYQVSATYNTKGVNSLLPPHMMAIPQIRALFESTPEMLQPLLQLLDEQGCGAYLEAIGMQHSELEALRTLLCDSE